MSDTLQPEGPSEGLGKLFADEAREAPATPYLVLARKYRPSSFEDLIGQEAMVKTLSNAFDLDRIHQAYMLTGVRGVGKTTTARILARAFNYELPLGDNRAAVAKPTIHMPEIGSHCQAIIESRHVDVIEMDAASHTGIDDVREIIESARYRPVMARTKVYIIDEVHMLSKQAFNGLLKTLEEPPEHVKFLFATTEIDKVPVTVRSRCQRFDLRRVEAPVMVAHLARICARENVPVEEEALAVIARAAEGSVRDALSLLDQAIALGAGAGGTLDAMSLRMMLGLADRTRIIDLFEEVMRGDMAAALRTLKDLHESGGEPGQILVDLADFVHFVTRLKLVPEAADDPAATPDERVRGKIFAKTLSMAVLTRAWQLLLKGLGEVKDSPRPLAAADMVLVRLAYAADLPPPDEVLRRLGNGQRAIAGASGSGSAPRGGGGGARAALAVVQSEPRQVMAASQPSPNAAVAMAVASPAAAPAVRLLRFEDVVALCAEKRDIQLKGALERDVHLVRFDEGSIEFSLAPGASPGLTQTLMRKLQEWTGTRWMITLSRDPGAPSLKQQADERAKATVVTSHSDPLVQSIMAQFPGAKIVEVRDPTAVPEAADAGLAVHAEPLDDGGDDIGFDDTLYSDDDL
ncbi:DNA polymerase III subunit gamma/tau [Beijerinckia sp. L45]|uniref:DNA polymerase III subunit gamma/tau n=1 Tax=Beijerinckia sp. L45 TaxID=1641855 RepID=UPI00131EBF85|nr:DNA polymerase III subunit gamma/tau [Beijerinckia sp. L45]